MDIKEMLINKKVMEEAKELQIEILKTLDKSLLDFHYCITGKMPFYRPDMEDGEFEKCYIEIANLRKLLSGDIENFINADIEIILSKIPSKLGSLKGKMERLLSERVDR